MAIAKPPAKSAAKPAAVAPKSAPARPAPSAPPTTVTLRQIAAQLAEAHSMQKNHAEAVMSHFVRLVTDHLKAGERLRIGGLGILEVKNRPARTGRNPATGAPIQIAASKKIAFRPAKELKEAV
jgi:DNA-binding protein HU-beta